MRDPERIAEILRTYPRFWNPHRDKPFDPIKLAEMTREIVCDERDGVEYRKYTGFYVAGVYRGIVTACGVGCCLRCFFCWVPLSREYPERYGRFYSPREVVENIVYLARKHGVYKARISCCEPTIGREHLLQVLELIERVDDIKLFILETNGILFGLDRDFVREVLKFRKVYVRLSLKAGTPEGFTWRTGAIGHYYELPFRAIEYFVEEGVALKRFHVAAMTDPRIMSPEERRALIERLERIDPLLAQYLEEEVVDPYETTLIRLREAGIHLKW